MSKLHYTSSNNNSALTITYTRSPSPLLFFISQYTLSNYKFAAHIDPENQSLLKRVAWAKQQRDKGRPTIPTTIKIEKDTNPFMRVQDQSIQANCKLSSGASPVEVLGRVREMKNNFR